MIVRTECKNRYTAVPNALLEDSALDWKDVGLLVYLLSKPDNWEISVEHLKKQKKLGRDGIYKCLDAIIAAGYAKREKQRDGSIKWFIFDTKTDVDQVIMPNPENPEKAEQSQIRKSRNTENPNPENPTLINTDNKQILINKTTNPQEQIEKQSDNGFDEFWSVYPRKVDKNDARKAWAKIKPNDLLKQVILNAVNRAKKSEDWQRKNGQYIPYPTTYLNGKRWEDEVEEAKPVEQSSYDNVRHLDPRFLSYRRVGA